MSIGLTSPIRLLSGLRLARKFQILGAIAVVLVVVPFYQFFTAAQDGVSAAGRELSGFEPAKKLLEVVTLTQQHRGLSTGALAGNAQFAAEVGPKKAEVDRAVGELEATLRTLDDVRIQEAWGRSRQEWGRLASSVASRSVTSENNFTEHTRLIAEYLAQLDMLVDYYGFNLDPRAESTFLIQAAYVAIPRLNEALGQLRALGSGHLTRAAQRRTNDGYAREVMTLSDRTLLAATLASASANLDGTVLNLNKAINISPKLRQSLQTPLTTAQDSAQRLLVLIRDEVAEAQELSMEPGRYFASVTETMGAQLRLSDVAVAALGDVLNETVSSLRTSQITTSLFIVALMVIGSLLSFFVMRTITGPVGYLQGVMEKLRQGDSSVRARLDSTDEIGELARQFDSMVDEREAVAAKIKKENEQLSDSVLVLLQGVARFAQRDLTAKVPVAEDVTGAVSDALNLLTSETAKVLKQVTDISADVTGASLKVKEQSDNVLAAAEVERQQVEMTAEELRLAAQAMERIQQLAQSANQAADNAIRTTQSALATVTATVGGINSTRDTIRETEKRIKRLGERSQEISGVVGLINTIAERTHILALNASMHAASAGEAGRGFAVVAEEVQRLAENARQATAQIATLVNNIQIETVDTVNTMNAAITQVVDGSRLAEQAGEQMKLTEATTAELVESVRQIAVSSQEQAKTSSELLVRAGDIRKSTEQTSHRLIEQAGQTANLVEYARALLGAVRVFKLPA